jgi:outer membrane protein assembly complex protein YaeT
MAQTAVNHHGKIIRKITVEQGTHSMPPEEYEMKLPIRPGEAFSEDGARAAMQTLFRTGWFSTLQLEVFPEGEEIDLLFRGDSAYFIGNVSIDGAPGAVSRGALVNGAKLPLGQPFEEGLANQAVESLEEVLRFEGYYNPNIKYALDRDPLHSLVDIHFFVEPGPRARFSEPVFTGSPTLPESRLIKATNWRRPFFLPGWRYINSQGVQSGLRRIRTLFAKQDFLMAKVQVERMQLDAAEAKVLPTIRVEPGPQVDVSTEGFKINRSTLRRLVPIYEEQSVDRDLLLEGGNKISSELRARGYFENKVEYEVEQDDQVVEEIDPNKNAHIVYRIDPGQRFRVGTINIEGNTYFRDETIEERMNARGATLIRYRRGRFSDEILEADKLAITELYRSNGFLDVEVSAAVTNRSDQGENVVDVKVTIAENKQSLIEELRIEGVADSDKEFLAPYITAAVGQPFSRVLIDTDRDRILALLYQNGYAAARFETDIARTDDKQGVIITYRITGGPRNYVREVIVTGLRTTRRDLVEKRILIDPGEALDNTQIFAAQRKLYDLGIFAKVDTALMNPDGAEMYKTVLFNLEEASRWSFNGGLGAEIARIGGGITSLDAPAGGAGFSPRVSFGVNRGNFLGLGHTVGVQTRISNIQQRALLTYLAPQFRDNDDFSLTFTTLLDDSKNVRTFNSKRAEVSLQLQQRVDLSRSFQYRVTYRDVRVDANTIKIAPSLIPVLVQPARVGSVSSTYIRERRDDQTDATRGSYTTVDFGLSSRAFLSSANFTRLLARNSSYYRIGKEIVFARSLTFGIIDPYGSTNQLDPATRIPLAERFFGGGANSHRGFPENQAGPRDLVTGFPVGGNAILTNNLELRFPLLGDNLGGVFFHDAGNIYSSTNKISWRWSQRDLTDFDYMVHAVGFGLRYRTPIGPVRIDLAYSPNSARFNGFEGNREDLLFGRGRATQLRVNRFQFHISLGQAF